MQSTTVRVNQATHQTLTSLAKETKSSIQAVLSEAVEVYRRERFLQRVNQAYADLRRNPGAWADHRGELEVWEITGTDGL